VEDHQNPLDTLELSDENHQKQLDVEELSGK